jgi:methionyl-tRNA formyltransferase
MQKFKFIFFGTSNFSVYILNELFEKNLLPLKIVTFPDKPLGRKLVLTPNPVKKWAVEKNIQLIESSDFRNKDIIERLKNEGADVFIVASFGKILPDEIIYMPEFKTLNVHPSLLPRLRGPSPIQGAILSEEETGVSIMRLTSKMDEGPILSQVKVAFKEWPVGYIEAEKILGTEGGSLLADVLPKWIDGLVLEKEQNHLEATYTKMIKKSESDISQDSPFNALRKIKAYEVWPRARIGDLIITKARIENDELVIEKVIPPGKNEMTYSEFKKTN